MDVRKLYINDYKEYMSHINSNIEHSVYENFVNNILNENHQIVVIIDYDSKIIGSGTLLIEHKLTYGGCKMGHIENILVNENMRGKKFGSMIIKYLNNIAIINKCYRVDLSCIPELIPFYKSNGYNNISTSMTMLIPENYNI